MKLRFAQIGAIAFYEMRMLWRQRILVVFTLSTLALTGVLLVAVRVSAGDQYDASLVGSNTMTWITLFWPLLYSLIILLSGLAVIDVMPRDRLWNVKPILDGTPLTCLTYLLGKLGGAWLAILLSLFGVMLAAGSLGWLAIGPYEIGMYSQMWLGGALPLALLHVGVSLMLAAFAPTRRWAVLVVLLFGFACVLLGTLDGQLTDVKLWQILNPGRPYVYRYFWLGWVNRAHSTSLGGNVIWLSLSIGLLQLIAAGSVVWLWLRAREGRE